MVTITYQDASKQPIDLTGYTARLQIRAKVSSTEFALELTEASGLTLGGPAGTIDIALTPTQTESDLDGLKSAVYDLELTSPAGIVTTISLPASTVIDPPLPQHTSGRPLMATIALIAIAVVAAAVVVHIALALLLLVAMIVVVVVVADRRRRA